MTDAVSNHELEMQGHKVRDRATFGDYHRSIIAEEISTIARYCDQAVQLLPTENDNGALLSMIECRQTSVLKSMEALEQIELEDEASNLYIFNGNFNFDGDFQDLLERLHARLNRHSRVCIVAYSPYIGWLYRLKNRFSKKKQNIPNTFFTLVDFENLAQLTGFEVVRVRPSGFFPMNMKGVGNVLNKLLSVMPWIRWFNLATITVFRPKKASVNPLSVSIIVPARNEKGNIENVIKRLPKFPGPTEIFYVEGHSKDGTWEEIKRVETLYRPQGYDIQSLQQLGIGKVDAARLGLTKAKGELLVILDADLTMPPEDLLRFYNAYRSGLGDFINGSRLVYPMEGEAMRTLNKFGNKFFAKILSFLMETRITDSLCGTKVFHRKDYQRMVDWRRDFGDVDPFGDFELLFPAATLGLGIVDVPIHYKDRQYGSTQIQRFRHGAMLLKMVAIGFLKITIGKAGYTRR